MIRNSFTALGLASLAALGLAATGAHAQTTFTAWDFNNSPVATNLSPATSVGTGTASTLGMTNTYGTPGPSMDISDILLDAPGTSDPSATSNGWRIRGGMVTGGATAANGWSSLAPQYTQGAQFLTSTAGEKNIIVSFDWNPTAQGVGDLQLQYTTNGTTFVNAGPAFSAVSGINGLTGSQFYNGLTFNFSSITAANNDPNFGIRMVSAYDGTSGTYTNTTGAALNNSSGNWRFDEVKFSGAALAAAPEPGGVVGMVIGVAGLGLLVARRKVSRA